MWKDKSYMLKKQVVLAPTGTLLSAWFDPSPAITAIKALNATYCTDPYSFDYDYCQHGVTDKWYNEARFHCH
jgi:hypothetical protein